MESNFEMDEQPVMNYTTTTPVPAYLSSVPGLIVALLSVRAIVALIGIFFNLELIYVICKNKSLHSSCSFLLVLNAFVDILYEYGCVVSGGVANGLAFNGFQYIKRSTCIPILIPALFGSSATMSFTLAIGFDRLIKAAFPTFFNRNYKLSFYYMTGLVAVCVSYALYITYGCVSTTISSPKLDDYVQCTTPDIYGDKNNLIIRNNIILNFLIALCYIFVWIVIKRQRVLANSDYEAATRRLFKSLSVTVLVSFCGSFIYSVWTLAVIYVVRLPFMTTWAIGFALSIIIVAASASYAPVLFVFSKEYKRAFQRQFLAIGKALRLSASRFAASKESSVFFTTKSYVPAMAQTPVVTPRMTRSPSGQHDGRLTKVSIAVSPFEIPGKPA